VSIAGYTAFTMEMVNVRDAYDTQELKRIDPRLTFDRKWDDLSGYTTRQVLTAPVKFEDRLFGVIQLINKQDGSPFGRDDERNLREVARILGIAFRNQMRFFNTRFNYLLSRNIVTDEELRQAIILSRELKRDIVDVLMEFFKVRKRDIGMSLGQFYGCTFFEYTEGVPRSVELARGLSISYLRKALWLPIALDDGKVTVVVENPIDTRINEIKNVFKASRYEFRVALKEDILCLIDDLEARIGENAFAETLAERFADRAEAVTGGEQVLDSEIVRLTNRIIKEAREKGASDIHIEPVKDAGITRVRFRIDGVCIPHVDLPYNVASPLISRIKIMAGLKIDEKRLPQDGKIKFIQAKDRRPVELRVATLPTVNGEYVVMRILSSSTALPVENLNLSARNRQAFLEILARPNGIFLVVGPTGSGKTTTLHSALGSVNTPQRKIWTAEDPVEITQQGLCQVEIRHQINFDFARALRAFLRADPDLIMIGEIRDLETALIAVEASLTGHLVMSTLHTNSAAETVTRLVDMGLDPFNFSDALLGVLGQRLVRTLCPACKEAYHPDEEEYRNLEKGYGKDFFGELKAPYAKEFVLYRSRGCERCNDTGYLGRMAIHELLTCTRNIKTLIQGRADKDKIQEEAVAGGMRTMLQDGIAKVLAGDLDYREVRRFCVG
jgi:type II secretory ATPase GspE/PulE/Tfp pilus assembly ATPase PilB-like protein